jgi:chemotaxis protein CheX
MISTDDLLSVTRTCWDTLLALPVESAPPREPGGPSATVTIRGAYDGVVELALSPALAARAARIVLDAPAPADDDVRATVLELTNILGGNLKARLPQPSRLGLPSTDAADGRVLHELNASCDGEPIRVRVRQAGGAR